MNSGHKTDEISGKKNFDYKEPWNFEGRIVEEQHISSEKEKDLSRIKDEYNKNIASRKRGFSTNNRNQSSSSVDQKDISLNMSSKAAKLNQRTEETSNEYRDFFERSDDPSMEYE